MRNLIILFFVTFTLTSCFQNKRLYYLQDTENREGTSDSTAFEYKGREIDHRITKNNILTIRILSNNSEISNLIDINSGNDINRQSNNKYHSSGYVVNDSGYIHVPVYGKLKVEGLTIEGVKKMIQKETDRRFEDAISIVKLVDFKITFIGELSNVIYVYEENVNVLEAFAIAGGIPYYGKMDEVLIIRETEDGHKTFRIDLTKRDILESDNFYLMPNDIVYVEPVKFRAFTKSVSEYSFLITTITTFVTTTLLIINLAN